MISFILKSRPLCPHNYYYYYQPGDKVVVTKIKKKRQHDYTCLRSVFLYISPSISSVKNKTNKEKNKQQFVKKMASSYNYCDKTVVRLNRFQPFFSNKVK